MHVKILSTPFAKNKFDDKTYFKDYHSIKSSLKEVNPQSARPSNPRDGRRTDASAALSSALLLTCHQWTSITEKCVPISLLLEQDDV